jgi:phosphatidylglycerol---prolipoprotein diacylglyceryl transferase
MPQPFLERVMEAVERALTVQRRRDERPIDRRKRAVIQLVPSLNGDLRHVCGNAIGGLDRLVASHRSSGRRGILEPDRNSTGLVQDPNCSDDPGRRRAHTARAVLPVLFEVAGVPIYSHGFFLMLGLLTCLAVVIVEARRRRWPAHEVIPIGLAAFVGGMIGARVAMLFFHGWDALPFVVVQQTYFDPAVGPGSILGGVLGAYIGGHLASRSLGKAGCTCDAFAPAMALGMAVGRVGDYLSAEDGLGKATTLPWGVTAPGVDYLVHPAPLYDAAFNLVWFGALLALRDQPRLQDGNLLKLAIAGYAAFRFAAEFVRNNEVLVLGLTGQQYTCMLALAGIAIYYARRRRVA